MNKYLITFKETANHGLLERYNATNIKCMKRMKRLATCFLTNKMAKELSQNNSIESVENDNSEDFSDTFDAQEEEYVIDLMDVKEFHEKGYKGQGVKVAVLDTGVQKHEDLVVAGGYNAYDDSIPYDRGLVSSHGTRVAGVIAAQDNDQGGLGVAPEVELYAVRIDDGSGGINRTLWSSQIEAMDWCIENGMDAVNCSFSSDTESNARREAFEEAYNAGIAIFCSAGNKQSGVDVDEPTVAYPSKYHFVNTVASINSDKTRYKTSSVGRGINFSSGGVSIKSTTIDKSKKTSDKYNSGTGTSYAAPAVLGMFALYKSMYGESRDKTLQRMYVNAERLGDEWEYGAGVPKFPEKDYENIQIWGR